MATKNEGRAPFVRITREVVDDGRDVGTIEVLKSPDTGKQSVSLTVGKGRLFVSRRMANSLVAAITKALKEAPPEAAPVE